MTKILQSSWVAALLGGIFYLGTTILLWHPPDVRPLVQVKKAKAVKDVLNIRRFGDPELDQLAANLTKQRLDIDGREKRLQEWEARLQGEQQDLARLTSEVEKRQAEFDKLVTRVRTEESGTLKKLAKIYVAMAPATATAVFREMSDDELLKILALMKESELTPILESFAAKSTNEAKRVALLTARMRLTLLPTPAQKP